MTFRAVIAWLDEHLGRTVIATVLDSPQTTGNSGAVLRGELREGTQAWGLIDSRGGGLHGYDVGEGGGFFLLEGDFVGAEVDEGHLLVELRELQINVGVV